MRSIDTAAIDKKSEELFAEFLDHVKEVQAENPEATDERLIFQGWMLQKIAGLQVIVAQTCRTKRAAVFKGSPRNQCQKRNRHKQKKDRRLKKTERHVPLNRYLAHLLYRFRTGFCTMRSA